jgi:hypothetical protein
MLETPKALDTIIFKQTKKHKHTKFKNKTQNKNYFISENSNGCYNGQSAGNQKFYTF